MGGSALSGLLLDTHIWFWHLIGSSRLPSSLRIEIDRRAKQRWLSPVSIWELGKLRERKRVGIPDDYRGWLAEARTRLPCREAALNREVALLSLEIDLGSDDPADRFLAATALAYDLELATVDRRLIEMDGLQTLPR